MHLGTQSAALPTHHQARTPLLALLAASLTLIQCRQVGDSLTGVNVDLFRRKDECTAKCQDEFKARNKVEDTLHAQNIVACGANPTCLAAENARHIAAQNASKSLRDDCLYACHLQGGGTIGQ